jgi:pullulanase/glycogen debranching enzyme
LLVATASLFAWSAPAALGPESCNLPSHYAVLQAVPADAPAIPAQAYWLNRQLLQWPQVQATTGRFRLYYSAQGQIVVKSGSKLNGADGALTLDVYSVTVPSDLVERFKYIVKGVVLSLRSVGEAQLSGLLRQQLVLVQEDEQGSVLQASALQIAGALDDLYASAASVPDLGVQISQHPAQTGFKLWAPTARKVSLCVYATGNAKAEVLAPMQRDDATGVWQAKLTGDRSAQYYTYLVDVFVPGVGVVRNRVTDPYSISLTTDSRRSYIADLNATKLKPSGWDWQPVPHKVKAQTDMVIYELHVRDFSINDASVKPAHRGKYLAFTERNSNGMKHLQALAQAGMTDVHLLPVFDIATIPEQGCVTPRVMDAAPDSEVQQATVMTSAATDCFNWGYDPFHFNAPEGSYASDAADGATRILEFRRMVQALHQAGLRVGMDVVYNHTAASGQSEKSVLDRIVPGYYQRLDANGVVERSTCCDNTATEHRMMGKLMLDSVELWAHEYKIDSFRFDLMAHQPLSVMQALQARVNRAVGREVNLIGEGWNFGEVANNARFAQASQLMLNGSGIGTFSDRGRDAVRGGSASDSGVALVKNQGYINGLVYAPNALADAARPVSDLMKVADLVRVGLAGSIRDYAMTDFSGVTKTLKEFDYAGQPAGYVSQPGEVVNYVENHDNQTLFDINALRLPLDTTREDRVRVQMLGAALNAFSQGVAYFHAGIDTLRSKSLDSNSFDSGDWFNRIDWSYRDNYFGSGAPPAADNRANYAWIKPLLKNSAIKPGPGDIALARDMFRDLLKIRASSTLFRLRTAADIQQRLRFYNTGPTQNPVLQVAHLDGLGYPGAGFKELLYLVNVDQLPHDIELPTEKYKAYELHPVHRAVAAADKRPQKLARYAADSGKFTVPARTAMVWVVH